MVRRCRPNMVQHVQHLRCCARVCTGITYTCTRIMHTHALARIMCVHVRAHDGMHHMVRVYDPSSGATPYNSEGRPLKGSRSCTKGGASLRQALTHLLHRIEPSQLLNGSSIFDAVPAYVRTWELRSHMCVHMCRVCACVRTTCSHYAHT